MTQDFAPSVRATLILFLFTVLATRMRHNHVIIRRLLVSATKTFIKRKSIFSIAVIAVRTCPGIKSPHVFGSLSLLTLSLRISSFLDIVPLLVLSHLLLLFDLVLSLNNWNVFLLLIELIYPLFDAAEMERHTTLLATPNGTPLVNRV
jgi:hypothetical protein